MLDTLHLDLLSPTHRELITEKFIKFTFISYLCVSSYSYKLQYLASPKIPKWSNSNYRTRNQPPPMTLFVGDDEKRLCSFHKCWKLQHIRMTGLNHCGNNDAMAWFSYKLFMSHAGYVRGISTHLFKLFCFCMHLFSCIKLKHKSIGVAPFIILQIKTSLPRLISVFCKLSDWNPILLVSKEWMLLHSVSLESTFWTP